MGKKILCISLVFLVFFSACIKEPAIEDRLLCLDLTSYSKADVPECGSQESCFAEVEKAFKGKENVFVPLIENNLSELKNNVALSWLYFNRALEKMREINKSCLSSKNLVGLDNKANELNHNLVRAFEKNDEAHALAFSTLLLQKSFLEEQKIDLIKEEKLYDGFISINNNLNEFNGGKNFGQASFASNYFLNVKKFEEFSGKINFEKTTIAQVTIFDIINGFDEKILARVPKEPFYLPMISDSVSSLIEYITNTFTLQQSVKLLKSNPSFELFEIFNRFAAIQNSSIGKFFELNRSVKESIKQINENNEQLKEKITQEFEEIQKKISRIDEAAYSSFDKEFLSGLASLLSGSSSIGESVFEITEFDRVKVEASAGALKLRKEFNDLISKEFLLEISLGEKTSNLKEILSKSRLLNENLDFLTKKAFESVVDSCSRRVLFINEQIAKTDYTSFDESILLMVQRIKNNEIAFKEAGGEQEKLVLCRPIVEEFNSLKTALENFEDFKILEKKEFENCFLEVRQVFESNSNYFLDLTPLYSKLSALENKKNNSGLLAMCQNLKEKIFLSFSEIKEVQEITLNHLKAEKVFEQLEILNKSFPELIPKTTFSNLLKKLGEQKKFFGKTGLIPSKALANLEELNASSLNLLGELNSVFSKYFSSYIEKNTEISTASDETVKANTITKTLVKIAIKNDMKEYLEPVLLKIPVKNLLGVELTSASSNVIKATPKKNELLVELNSVPTGLTAIFLNSKTVFATTKESLKNLFLAQNNALMEHVVLVEAKTNISNLEISTSLAEFAKTIPESINVLFKQNSIPFSVEEGKISFKATNVSNKDKISIFYEIKNPLKISFELIDNNKIDANNFEYVFSAKIKNTTDLEFKKTRLTLPIPINEKKFSKAKIFDSTGKTIPFEKTLLNEVSIAIKEIFPKQAKEFLVKLEVKNYSSYWSTFIVELEQKISLLASSEQKKIREKAVFFKKKIEKIKKESDFKNSKQIKELLRLAEKINEALKESNFFESEKTKFIELKKQVEEEIEKTRKKASNLEKGGYRDDAKKLLAEIEKAMLQKEQANKKSIENPKTAFLELLNAKNFLAGLSPKDLIESIEKQKKDLMEKANKLFELKIDDSLKQEIIELEEKIRGLMGQNEFILAQEKLKLLQEKVVALESKAKEKTKKEFFKQKKKISLFNELIKKIPEKIGLLKKLFDSTEKYGELKYFFPTTLARLDKLLLKFNSIPDSSLLEKIGSANTEFANDFASQLLILTGLGEKFDKKIESLKKIDKEVSNDLAKIKGDATIVLEFAKIKSKQAVLGENAKQALFLAEEKINSKEFIESMELSKKAIGLIGFSNETGFNIPIAVYPLVLIAATALYFKFKKSRAPLPQKKKIEKVKT